MELTYYWAPRWAVLLPQNQKDLEGPSLPWKPCSTPMTAALEKGKGQSGNFSFCSFHPDSQIIGLEVQMSSGLQGICLWKGTR